MEDDAPVPEALTRLVAPHVDSFDYFLSEGMQRVQEALTSLDVVHPSSGSTLSAWVQDLRLGKPLLDDTRATETMRELRVFPRECRQAGTSYTAPLTARLFWKVDDGDVQSKEMRLSNFPVMVRRVRCALRGAALPRGRRSRGAAAVQVRSLACNLHGLTSEQLKKRGEEPNEVGGYFIVNGNEKLLRLLINQRRHYIMGMVRGAYARRGPTFSEFATAIRCVARDESSMTVRVHYLTNGSARLAFVLRRQEFFIPVRARHPCGLSARARR